MSSLRCSALAALGGAALLLVCAPGARGQVEGGEFQPPRPPPLAASAALLIGQHVQVPDNSDRVYNRFGLRRLYALTYRRPLLVVAWRADDPVGTEAAVPAALSLQERCGDDLVVLLVERSGLPYADMLRFVCSRQWLCGAALWTSDAPANTGAMTAPSFVLTSLRQTVVLAGHPERDRIALQDAIDRYVDERRHGAEKLPAEAHDAWTAFEEGRYARALDIGKAITKRKARGKPGDAEAAAALEDQSRFIEGELSTRLDLATDLVFSGGAAESFARLAALFAGLEDLPDDHPMRRRAQDALQGVRDGALASELKASEDLAKLQEQMCRKGPGTALARSLRKLAETYSGTHVADRAQVLAGIAEEP